MPSLGAPEIVIILVLALLVFGPKRLPEMGRSLGRGVREFRKASDTARKEFGVDEIEKEIKGVKTELKDVQQTVTDVKADLKIDVDAEAAKPDPGKAEGAAAGAGAAAAAVTPETGGAGETSATDDEVLVGDVVDEEPVGDAVAVDPGEAVPDEPVDVTDMTAGYEPPAVSSDPASGESPGAPSDGGEAAATDARLQGA